MNPEYPSDPRQELEARLSALILGELPPEEAESLRVLISQDPELALLHRRLELTVGLLREVGTTESVPDKQPARQTLSEAKRQQLLASFKTSRIPATPPVRWSQWLVPAAAAMIVGLLLLGTAIPELFSGRSMSARLTPLPSRKVLYYTDAPAPGRAPTGMELPTLQAELPTLTENSDSDVQARRRFLSRAETPREPAVAPSSEGRLARGFGGGIGGGGGLSGGNPPVKRDQGIAMGIAPASGPAEQLSIKKPSQVAASGAREEPKKNAGVLFYDAAAPHFPMGRKLPTPQVELPASSSGEALGDRVQAPNGAVNLSLGAKLEQSSAGVVSAANQPISTNNFQAGYYSAPLKLQDGGLLADSAAVIAGQAASKDTANWAEHDKDAVVLPEMLGRAVAEEGRKAKIAEARGVAAGTELAFAKESTTTLSSPLRSNRAAADLRKQFRNSADSESEVALSVVGHSSDSSSDVFGVFGQTPITVNALDLYAKSDAKKRGDIAREAIQLGEITVEDKPAAQPVPVALVPQPDVLTSVNRFSTFSLNVSDVSFKLAAAALEKGTLPGADTIRTEEFINAFDYHDPEPAPGAAIAFAWETAQSPFAQNRDLLRFSIKTAAEGRQVGKPLNLVVLLDNSGSMERADRVQIIQKALRALSTQLQPQDRLSIVLFSRTARLWVDGIAGDKVAEWIDQIGSLVPQGGTNLEEAMNLGYQTVLRHYTATGINRVILLTDGAANLGNVEPASLKEKVEGFRRQGIALDCFGIGWEGYNDAMMESLSRNGDGRYGFINTPEEAETGFVSQLAGALRVAASDVKVQVEFNPDRVNLYRQIGYARHQLTKEQFRDNTVDAAEIGAAESGNALYAIEVNSSGLGPIATLRVRYKVPGTAEYKELEWLVPYTGAAPALQQASPAMRLAATASSFSEWLASNPFAGDVTPDALLKNFEGVPQVFAGDNRPKQLEWMIRQAKSLAGK